MGAEEEGESECLDQDANLCFSLHFFSLQKWIIPESSVSYYQQEVRLKEGGEGEINLSVFVIITYLHLIVHFWRVLVT